MLAAAGYGAAFGLLPIGWIVLNAVFLYTLTVETGAFEIVKRSVLALSDDRRVQALLIAFCFGAFLEGAAGFGTPVAISAALMVGAGFRPLHAAGLALLANTSPVAFGALGTPITTLARVTGLDELKLSAMAGRQLPFFSLLVPAWLVWVMAGWRGVRRRLAGAAGLRRQVRRGAVPRVELPRPVAGGRGRRRRLAGRAWRCCCASGSRPRPGASRRVEPDVDPDCCRQPLRAPARSSRPGCRGCC